MLWMISSTPIIFSCIKSLVSGEDFTTILENTFNLNILFVYTTSFISPFLYMAFSRSVYPHKEKLFPGILITLTIAFFIILFSAFTYGDKDFAEYASAGSYSLIACYIIYFISIYLWFLSIADNEKDGAYYFQKSESDLDDFLEQTKR